MSIVAFKKKSVIRYGTKRSGIPTTKNWIYPGPYGTPATVASNMFIHSADAGANAGFSLQGPYRNRGRVGSNNLFSRSATPFRGVYPKGNGGTNSQYPTSVSLNITPVLTGVTDQTQYVKPSVLSTYGMLARRYRWINNGSYPVNWVQPNYTGNQTDSASQGVYLSQKSAANDCHVDVNNSAKYEGHTITCQASQQCQVSQFVNTFSPEMIVTKGYKMWNVRKQPRPPIRRSVSAYAPYTKSLHVPQTSSQHTLHIQRKCANPRPDQKPFPYAVSSGTGILQGGIRVNPGNSCNTTAATRTTAPVSTIQ